jgi:hypothetical protein
VRAWTSVAAVFLCVAAFYSVLVTRRVEQHSVRWFVHIGQQFLTTSTTSTSLTPSLGWQSPVGYDGQYYFAVAVDPVHARDYIGGNSGVVYSRVFYPAVAGIAGGGTVTYVPYAMLAINLAAVVGAAVALAVWLARRGAHAWPAVLFALYPGMIFAVVRDLTEPLAFGLTAAAILAFDPRRTKRLVLACVLFALALLTRETVAPFVLAALATVLVATSGRERWRRGAWFAVGAFGPLFAWRIAVTAWLGQSVQERGGSGWGIPFHGILAYRPWDHQHRLIVATIIVPSLLLAAAAVPLLLRPGARIAGALLLANILLFVVFLPVGVDVDYGAASRAAIGVVLAAVCCVPHWRINLRERVRLPAAAVVAFSWSILWYLVVANFYGLDAMNLISL